MSDDIEMPDDMPEWAQLIYRELVAIRRANIPESKLVDSEQAGQILGIAARTVRDWHKNGKMPKLASGKGEHLRWERVAVERLAQANKRGGRPRNVA